MAPHYLHLRHAAQGAQQFIDALVEIQRIQAPGFFQHRQRTGGQGAHGGCRVAHIGTGGQHHNRQGIEFKDARSRFIAVEARHMHIHGHYVRAIALQHIQGLLAIVGGAHLITRPLEHRAQQYAQYRRVVNDQYAHGHGPSLRSIVEWRRAGCPARNRFSPGRRWRPPAGRGRGLRPNAAPSPAPPAVASARDRRECGWSD
ncbi:hypothetical protein FQZ97_830030 [compost metagenome]